LGILATFRAAERLLSSCTLLQAPNPHSIRGMRDRALLGVLVTCAWRRGELSRMNCEHLVMRDGCWVFLDFKGKGNKTRSVAVPLWVKQEIDGWLDVAGIEKGPIFRRVLANGRVGKDALTERAVWQLVVSTQRRSGSASWRRTICGARRRSYAARRAASWSKLSFSWCLNKGSMS
jgi:integrase